MCISERAFLKLANGSDVRGVSIEGVVDEPVTLNAEAANRITSVSWISSARRRARRSRPARGRGS